MAQRFDKVPFLVKVWLKIRHVCVSMAVKWLPFFRFIRETADYKSPITFDIWLNQKVRGSHRYCYWPIHPTTRVTNPENVFLGVETFPGYMPGCYIQAIGRISIGDHSVFSANVGLISSNHDLLDARNHTHGEINIGKYCWMGMNAIILPNVTLGDFTIVGAGAIVTKSFPEGHCVLAGNPAKMVRKLDTSECVEYTVEHRYHGYLTEQEYQCFRGQTSKTE